MDHGEPGVNKRRISINEGSHHGSRLKQGGATTARRHNDWRGDRVFAVGGLDCFVRLSDSNHLVLWCICKDRKQVRQLSNTHRHTQDQPAMLASLATHCAALRTERQEKEEEEEAGQRWCETTVRHIHDPRSSPILLRKKCWSVTGSTCRITFSPDLHTYLYSNT